MTGKEPLVPLTEEELAFIDQLRQLTPPQQAAMLNLLRALDALPPQSAKPVN